MIRRLFFAIVLPFHTFAGDMNIKSKRIFKKKTMKKLFAFCGMILFAGLLFTSCTKDEEEIVLPTITFSQNAGYVFENTTAAYGDTLNFGVAANSNGKDNLVKFQILSNGQSVMDSTINTAAFNINFYTIKSILDSEEWSVIVTDMAGNSFTKTITITGNFGALDSYTTILFGAQDNVSTESFLSLSNNASTLYFQAQAFEHQADIDMFCFFQNTPEHPNMMSLASPGANITGIFSGATSPDNYTTKNLTWFVKTGLTAAAFDAVQNDAVVIDAYDADNDYKKAKVLTAGDVYSFKLQNGKFGLLKVIAVNGEVTGTLEIAVKVQK